MGRSVTEIEIVRLQGHTNFLDDRPALLFEGAAKGGLGVDARLVGGRDEPLGKVQREADAFGQGREVCDRPAVTVAPVAGVLVPPPAVA